MFCLKYQVLFWNLLIELVLNDIHDQIHFFYSIIYSNIVKENYKE